jgi:putative serine protease PepD
VNRQTFVRRAAPIGAALALGGGAGAAVYAASTGGAAATTTVVSSIAAQPTAAKATVSTLTQLYKDVTPGVVDINVSTAGGGSGFFPGSDQQGEAEGSGFVIDTKGDIVTNAHVVDGASKITVRFADGRTASATVVGTDDSTDIAVIKVNVDSSQLHPLTLGTSSNLLPGQEVVAIGSPFGLPESMTAGIVSAVDRTITAPNNFSISGAIQTDAAINHGNSGGPLLNLNGEVIGVNAQIDSDSGGNDGVGFAVPIDAVKSVTSTLIAGGKVQHAYLGVHVGDAATSGAQVSSVQSGSPAEKAGLEAGDVITAIDGKSITNADDLTAAVSAHKPNDKVGLSVTRNGKTLTIDVTLGVRPS